MQKVWFGRIWCMTGRWQLMSLESGLRRPRIVEKAWLRQIYAPYLRGGGVALTVGPWSLRFGLCQPGIEVDESDDEFYWGDLDSAFDEHLIASVFSTIDAPEREPYVGEPIVAEPVTAFVDRMTNQLVALVHEGGEVEYVERKEVPREPLPWPP
jgi:hypothetical protein